MRPRSQWLQQRSSSCSCCVSTIDQPQPHSMLVHARIQTDEGAGFTKDQAPSNALLKERRRLVRAEEREEPCEMAPSGHSMAVALMSI